MTEINMRGAGYVNGQEVSSCSITVEQEMHTHSSISPRPDPNWTFVDSQGHFHARDQAPDAPGANSYPTLIDKYVHVDCDETHFHYEDDDPEPCEGYDQLHWHCRICDEEINPGKLTGVHHWTEPGMREWRAEVSAPVDYTTPVSLWLVGKDWTWFGVAQAHSWTASPAGATTSLYGIGPLGRTKTPKVPAPSAPEGGQ